MLDHDRKISEVGIVCKPLGKTGLVISEVRLGTWNYQGGSEALRKGLDASALFINEAKIYGAEPFVVQVLKGIRTWVFFATKVSRAKRLVGLSLACVIECLQKILPLPSKT